MEERNVFGMTSCTGGCTETATQDPTCVDEQQGFMVGLEGQTFFC